MLAEVIASENVTVTVVVGLTLVAPAAGSVAVTVGGVVSVEPPHVGQLGVAPVAVIEGVAVAAVVDQQAQLRKAGEADADALVGGGPQHHAAVGEQRRIAVDLEHHGPDRADLVVHPDHRTEAGVAEPFCSGSRTAGRTPR